jgi:hypothetical protein
VKTDGVLAPPHGSVLCAMGAGAKSDTRAFSRPGHEGMKRRLQHLRIAWVLAVGMAAPFSAPAQQVDGFGKGTTYHDVPGASTEILLLQSFQLVFAHGDNHIKKIELWPNRVPPDSNRFDTVRFTFADKRPWRPRRDRFYYWTRFYMGPLFAAVPHEAGGVSPLGPATKALPRPPNPGSIFALLGFSLEFLCSDDHHISQVAVREVDGNLSLALDGGTGGWDWGFGCNSYDANVMYTWLNPLDVFDWGTRSGSTPQSSEAFVPMHGGHMIVRGFDFRVSEPGKDEHLQMLGVRSGSIGTGATLQPFFFDKHGTESLPFDWIIDWAEIGQRYLRPPDLPPLSPEFLRDSEAARENAEEWMKRQELRMSQ